MAKEYKLEIEKRELSDNLKQLRSNGRILEWPGIGEYIQLSERPHKILGPLFNSKLKKWDQKTLFIHWYRCSCSGSPAPLRPKREKITL